MAKRKSETLARVGIGFDLHRMKKGRDLYLGGIRIDYPYGLLGHSDGDVILHAISDAILGSLAQPDIGCLFPDTDCQLRGISSTLILNKAIEIMRQQKFMLGNVDVIIICQEPKLNNLYEKIREKLATLLDVNPSQIGIKAKTAEHLGFLGKGKAIACWAVALLIPSTG